MFRSYLEFAQVLITNGRFVDRDMAMRYHWGHGVGHTYSHQSPRMQVSVIGNIQRDIEMGNILLPQSTSGGRRGPSSGGPSSFAGDDDEDNQDNGGGDDEDDDGDDYDDDDDDYDYEDDCTESEGDEISDTDSEDDQMHEMYD